MNINFREISGYVIGLVAAGIVCVLLVGTFSRDGYVVPDDLSEFVEQSEQDGFVPVVDYDATCFPEEQVSAGQLDDIETVTGEQAKGCQFEGDAVNSDALWGALAFAAVCVLLYHGHKLYKANHQVGIVLFAAAVVLALLAGAWLDDPFDRWLTENNVIAAIFWRGFGAAAVVTIGGFVAIQSRRKEVTAEAPAPPAWT